MASNKNHIRNPLLEVDEDISKMPIYLSFFEKIGLTSALIISIGIFLLTFMSLLVDIFVKLNLFSILIDGIIMLASLAAIYFIFNMLKKKIVTEALIDTAFQHGVYNRLQHLIENISRAQVDSDIIIERISNLDMKVENIMKERKAGVGIEEEMGTKFYQQQITTGTSVLFTIKAIFMMILTIAVFMFLVNFNLGRITPYAALSIFILWWLFITNEFSLWKDMSAWTMVFFPVLVIPISVNLLANFINYNVMMALIYLLLGLYALSYYAWAIYVTTGTLPFITPKREEEELSKFFAAQQKGMINEIVDDAKYRISKIKK